MAAIETELTHDTVRTPVSFQNTENRLGNVLREKATPSIFGAASKSVEFSDRIRSHYRETRRLPCEIPCDVEVMLMDGTVHDTGAAMLENISPSGALMGSFELKNNCLPTSLFKVRLVLKGDSYSGIGIEATPVRFASGLHGIGIKFDEIFVTV